MEILISITAKIAEYTVKPVGHQLGYLCFINNNIQKLKTNVEMLKETKETVQRRVTNARNDIQDIIHSVEKWLTEVDAVVEKSEGILVNEGQQDRLCLNLIQRHQISRKAAKMAEEVLEIINEGKFDIVSYPAALLSESSPTTISDFFNFKSRESTMEQIIDALLDDSFNKIGVYGMGGVGKTMLVKEISRKVMEKKSFDKVVSSTISQTPDLKNIQGQLADQLGLKFEQETVEGRGLKLNKRLKMEKKILIVLDDIWKYIELEKIGIPSVANDKGCKILFTSRDKDTLSNQMNTNKNFEITVLEEDESWNLFKKMAGETVEASNLNHIAIKIVKECAHLPIAITTVAKALKSKPSPIWEDALDQLRNPVVVNIIGMNEKVYSSLKFSYEQLECQEAKLLFLLCSMFPEDFLINVEDLHVYAMGMGFLHGVDTVAKGRRRITKLVDELISSSLLLQYEYKDDYVKMHDIVRDVAILIASKDDQIRTLSYAKRLNEWEEEKMSGNHTAVYLDVSGLHSPPQKLMLPKVQLLRLCGPLSNGHELSRTFFEEMKELKVLELSRGKILLFPPSPHSFANIISLHLCDCKLGTIDMIGELNKLEILSLRGSNISHIPMSISKLTRLKVLDLSYCFELRVILPNILLKLTKLEELYLETFKDWEPEELKEGRKNASVFELRYLPQLSALSLCIEDEKIMPKQLFSRELNLEKFRIIIGTQYVESWLSKNSFRMLHLEMEPRSCTDDWIKMLLKKVEELHLVGSIGAKVLLFELYENESSHVKYLYFSNNSELQHFIHEENKPLRKSLSNLEHLEMRNLENLESIIHENIRESPFNKLRVIKVRECKKLGSLFFKCILDELLNLEEILIRNCWMVQVIIVMESEETTNKIELPHLKSLQLEGLPRIQKFCSERQKFGQLSLRNSEKGQTSKFSGDVSFFNDKVSFPNLEKLIIKRVNSLKMIGHNAVIPNSFSKLKQVEIDSCNNLEKVFHSNMMSMLTSLQSLQIRDCNLLEGVFEVQEPDATTSVALLPNLRKLELFNLPKLEHVWSKGPRELQISENIQDLIIRNCPKLKGPYLPFKGLQQLEYLTIDFSELKRIPRKETSAQMLEMYQFNIFEVETIQLRDVPEFFSKLRTMKLYGTFDYNSTHLPMEIVRILHNLEVFEVREIFIEEIFPNERLINVEGHQNARSWHLRSLDLHGLPKLRHFWKEGSQRNTSSLQNLGHLVIERCGILNILVPSSVSFRNLTMLTVSECHKLTHLFNPSVARTMVQLRYFMLGKCKSMTMVIAGGADEENDEIIFNKLGHLTISDFSKLTSFYSGKCIIRSPCLNRVVISDCPEMKVFSLGVVSTPLLQTENIGLYYDHKSLYEKNDSEEIIVKNINVVVRQAWENNCDTRLQYLFTE